MTGKDPPESEVVQNFILMDLDGSGDIDKEEAYKFIKGFRLGQQL